MKKLTLLLLLTFAVCLSGISQTGYTDDFEDGSLTGWWGSSTGYTVTEADGYATVVYDKIARWASFGVDLGANYDLSAAPIANLKLMGSKGFAMDLYLVDNMDKNINIHYPIFQSDTFVNVLFDFTAKASSIDITNVRKIYFAINGSSSHADGIVYMDDLKLGADAEKLCNMGSIDEQSYYKNSGPHTIDLTFLNNVASFTLSGGASLISNHSFSSISGTSNGLANVELELVADAVGSETITITAVGTSGYVSNSQTFTLNIVDNMPPKVDAISDKEIKTGDVQIIKITGLSDGDIDATQDLSFTATSDNQSIIADGNMTITYEKGSPYAYLSLLANTAGNNVTITISITDDSGESNATIQTSFMVDAFDNYNFEPTIDLIESSTVKHIADNQSFTLTGISDGNNATQVLNFSVTSSDDAVINTSDISIDYTAGSDKATVNFSTTGAGTTNLTITLADDAAGTDNGVKQTIVVADIKVVTVNDKGLVMDLSSTAGWAPESSLTVTSVDSTSFKAVRVDANNKWLWGGLWISLPKDLDLTSHPYITMEVYPLNDRLLQWMWFYDDNGKRNDFADVTHDEGKALWVDQGEWTKITFDFSGDNEMSQSVDNAPVPINNQAIHAILVNFHNAEPTYPRPANYTGSYLIRNFRIGNEADMGFPLGQVDPIADQVFFEGVGEQTIQLSGISDGYLGNSALPNVFVSSSNPSFVSPTLSQVQPDGTATLTYTPSGLGSSTITVSVNGDSTLNYDMKFNVSVMAKNIATAKKLYVDPTTTYQTIQGFGVYSPGLGTIDKYTDELGATAMRIGLINEEFEPVNDNADPYVLNRDALDYSVFDYDMIRKAKDKGVNTFILTSWSPPAWMKENFSTGYAYASLPGWAGTDNRLALHNYDEFAELMIAAIRVIKEETGVDLYAIGLQNEPAFNEPYASAILDPEHFVEMVKVMGARLELEGLSTKIMMPEQVFGQPNYSMAAYIDAVQADPVADAYTDIIATHSYSDDGIAPGVPDFSTWTTMWNNTQEGSNPKQLMMTEAFPEYKDWNSAMSYAGALYGALKYGNISLWTGWGINKQLLYQGNTTGSGDVFSNYARFIRTDAVRVECQDTANTDLLATAFLNPAEFNNRLSVVVVNKGTAAMSIGLEGVDLPAAFEIYTSANHLGFTKTGVASITEPIIVPGLSVVTLVSVPGNLAPSANTIANQTISMNSGSHTVNLSNISDGNPDKDQVVSISAYSLNTGIIANSDISVNYTGGTTATLTYSALADKSGTATIVVRLKDDGGTANGGVDSSLISFNVSILNEINENPTITAVSDVTILEDAGTQTITLTGLTDGDNGGIDQGLTVTASSSNTSLIANPVVSAVGTDGTATLSYSPKPNINGTTIINLTIKDAGGNAQNQGDASISETFNIDVTAVNDAPVLDTIEYNTSALTSEGDQLISIYGIADGDADATQTLSLAATANHPELISNLEIFYDGYDEAIIKYTPVGDGIVTFTIALSDNGGTANGGIDKLEKDISTTISNDVSANFAKADIRLYPNPVQDLLHISANENIQSLSITDIQGKVMYSVNDLNSSTEIDTKNYENGIYFIQMTINDQTLINKFIKK